MQKLCCTTVLFKYRKKHDVSLSRFFVAAFSAKSNCSSGGAGGGTYGQGDSAGGGSNRLIPCWRNQMCNVFDGEVVKLKSSHSFRIFRTMTSQSVTTGSAQAPSNQNPFREPEGMEFFQKAVDLIISKALQDGCDRDKAVVDFKHPEELKSELDLELSAKPTSHDNLLKEMEKIIQYSIKTGHPHYHNQLYAGLDPYSQAGAWLTEATNTNIHTFESCPVSIVIEKYLMEKICGIIGYKDGDGTFLPGGSASNMFALNLAKYRKFPQVKQTGMYGLPRLRLYASEDSHYSLKKSSSYLGFGIDNVVFIKTDYNGRMVVSDLEANILKDKEQGFHPLFVMATSGTTVLGGFDPLVEISQVCQRHDLWLHNDACWGGPALLSAKYKHLLEGSELCDSLAWNFHKLNGIPLQCAALVVKQKGLMEDANKSNAEYLFQPDKFYDTSYDIGDKTILCGRKPDGLKLWLQWKALGDDGMAARIDKVFDNARYLADKLNSTEGFRLVRKEIFCTNVCFWYIPPRLRNKPETEEWWQEIKIVAPKIKERMVKAGSLMIGFQPLTNKGLVNFFRFVMGNPMNDHRDMEFVIEEIDRCGQDL